MNRYKFSEEEVPYGILEQFGLTREMIGDLPVNVLQAIHSGRRSPILPIHVNDSEGNAIHARTRFSLVRREDGTADVLFYPVLVESRLERFSEEQKQRLLEGKAVIAPMQGDNDTPVQAFHQIDSGTTMRHPWGACFLGWTPRQQEGFHLRRIGGNLYFPGAPIVPNRPDGRMKPGELQSGGYGFYYKGHPTTTVAGQDVLEELETVITPLQPRPRPTEPAKPYHMRTFSSKRTFALLQTNVHFFVSVNYHTFTRFSGAR